ncbi:glycosyltransferase family 2 protein [Beduini massiliensis]|uniref:glycosyltransferase family 2 protein n=1 Tax=Beduini massiliensis TaxID=1585974 RepID=UPI000693FB77|nr:glycosyltransferase family 2 protein [Beduini massiliensis]
MPVISIIMGVYNEAEKLPKSVNSILKQSFTDFELIICDDGSTDHTYKVLETFAKQDNRIIILKNKENKKLAYTLNRCIQHSKGDYIARMDADDYAAKNRLEIQFEFLEKHKEYAFVGTSRYMYDEKGVWGEDILNGEVKLDQLFTLKASFVHPTILIRKSALLEVNGYTDLKRTERTEDLDLWYKLYSKGYKGFNLENKLLYYFEDISSSYKRKYIYRINASKVTFYWLKKNKLIIKYFYFFIRPLIVGLLPKKILLNHHKNKYIIKENLNSNTEGKIHE